MSLRTSFAGIDWPVPLYINAMTGGSARAGEINSGLGIAARETGLPIASGPMSACFEDLAQAWTCLVLRQENPDGFLIANVSAEVSQDDAGGESSCSRPMPCRSTSMPCRRRSCRRARAFSHWARKIEQLVAAVDVPVIVKEVGFGLSRPTLEQLRELGVRIADVACRGGTDFARIENDRRRLGDFPCLLGWGSPRRPACWRRRG